MHGKDTLLIKPRPPCSHDSTAIWTVCATSHWNEDSQSHLTDSSILKILTNELGLKHHVDSAMCSGRILKDCSAHEIQWSFKLHHISHGWTNPPTATSEVIVLLVLLTWWQDLPSKEGGPIYEVLEFFSGVGRVAAMAKRAGYTTAAVDIEIGKHIGEQRGTRPPMDINSNAGLLLLGLCNKLWSFSFGKYVFESVSTCFVFQVVFTRRAFREQPWQTMFSFCEIMWSPNQNQLRLGIHLVLSSEFVAAFFAVVCSSYVPVNRGSTCRSLMTPLGNEDYPHVRRSNKMTSRTFQGYGMECCFFTYGFCFAVEVRTKTAWNFAA